MADKFSVTGEQYQRIDRRMREIKRQLDQEEGSPLNPELVALALQEIIEGRFFGSGDPRFELVNTFNVTVPEGYDHATRLDSFAKERRGEFYYYNDAITDKNFGKATVQLTPGRKFEVRVFQIKQRVTSQDCLALIKSQNGVLTGAQGASLAYEQGKDQLPVGRWSISFDEKDALWKDADGFHGVPFVSRYSGGAYSFLLGYFVPDCYGVLCVLVFRDLESSGS